jgi:hypothetical protein
MTCSSISRGIAAVPGIGWLSLIDAVGEKFVAVLAPLNWPELTNDGAVKAKP